MTLFPGQSAMTPLYLYITNSCLLLYYHPKSHLYVEPLKEHLETFSGTPSGELRSFVDMTPDQLLQDTTSYVAIVAMSVKPF